jgi:hypothetical protein
VPTKFNVVLHFINTPRFANTNPPAISASTAIVAAFIYFDDDHICPFHVLDLTYLPCSLASTATTQGNTGRSGTMPYKRRVIRSKANSQNDPSTASESASPPRARMQLNDTPGASTSTSSHPRARIQLNDMPVASASTSFAPPPPPVIPTTDETAHLLVTGDYDNTDLHGKRKINDEKDPADDDKKGKGKSKKGRAHA